MTESQAIHSAPVLWPPASLQRRGVPLLAGQRAFLGLKNLCYPTFSVFFLMKL